MTENGLILLKTVDINSLSQGQSKYNMHITYMLFYTAFITKEHFQILGEMVQKMLKVRKYYLFFVRYVCMLTDC